MMSSSMITEQQQPGAELTLQQQMEMHQQMQQQQQQQVPYGMTPTRTTSYQPQISSGSPVPYSSMSGQVTTQHYQGPATVTETTHTTNYNNSNYQPTGSYSSVPQQQYSSSMPMTSSTVHQSSYPQQSSYPMQSQSSYPAGQMTTYSSGPTTTTYQQQQQQIQRSTSNYAASPVYGQQYISGQQSTTEYTTGEYVLTGEERVIGVTTRVDESRQRIISEKTIEHEIRVPKRIIVEEVIEKIMIVPEITTREEITEEIQVIKETIIQVAKAIITEKVIEVPDIVIVEKIVEVVEQIMQDKIIEVPKYETVERIVEVPIIEYKERIVEVPEIEFRDMPYEKIIEVPEIREQVVIKEVVVPQYTERLIPEYVDVPVTTDVARNIPVPVEAVTTFEYRLAQFRPRVTKVKYPLYVPRFVEVPVAQELFDAGLLSELESQNMRLNVLGSQQAVGLCDIENLASDIRRHDVQSLTAGSDLQSALTAAWQSGRINLGQRFGGAPQQMRSGYGTPAYPPTYGGQQSMAPVSARP